MTPLKVLHDSTQTDKKTFFAKYFFDKGMTTRSRAIFASEMVRIGEDEVGGVKNDNLVRIGEEGGEFWVKRNFLVS